MGTTGLAILLVEDDLLLAQNLREELEGFGYRVTACCADSNAALTAYRQHPPDLMILDILLEGSPLNGIELADILLKIKPTPLIFLTSLSDKKTLEAARALQPANYLIKPYTAKQLDVAIDLAISNSHHAPEPSTEAANPPLPVNDTFFIKEKSAWVRIKVADVLYVAADNDYAMIHTEQGRHLFTDNLRSFGQQITHPSLLRIHRSYIVNIDKVQGLEDSYVHLYPGGKKLALEIGPSYRETTLERFRKLVVK